MVALGGAILNEEDSETHCVFALRIGKPSGVPEDSDAATNLSRTFAAKLLHLLA